MSTDAIVLDTHVLLWWLGDRDRLSKRALEALRSAPSLLLSPISFWEVAMLAGKARIELDRSTMEWTNDVLASPGITTAPLTVEVAVTAAGLVGLHGDPADRLIAATAITRNVPMVSKDRVIRVWAEESGAVACIW